MVSGLLDSSVRINVWNENLKKVLDPINWRPRSLKNSSIWLAFISFYFTERKIEWTVSTVTRDSYEKLWQKWRVNSY